MYCLGCGKAVKHVRIDRYAWECQACGWIQVTVKFSGKLWHAVVKYCQERGVSEGELIKRACEVLVKSEVEGCQR